MFGLGGCGVDTVYAGRTPDRSDRAEATPLVPPADPTSLPYPGVELGPRAPAFYSPPAAPEGAKPGDLIWARPVAAPPGSRAFGILYWSTSASGDLVAVSGVLIEPADAKPGTSRKIVAGAHGSTGLGDQCAPSRGFFDGTAQANPVVQPSIARGWTYVESDYSGLGTPGEHPFADARSAGRNVLDSIRAVTRLTAASSSESVLLGQSQGGGATLLGAELAPTYAPDVTVRGAVALAPPSNMNELDDQMSGGPYAGYLLMSLHGLLASYPELSAGANGLNEAGRTALAKIRTQCASDILAEYKGSSEREFGLDKVFDAKEFMSALARSDPARQPLRVPTLLVHGEQDDTIPVQNSRDLAKRYCASGAPLSARFVAGAGHVDVLFAAQAEIQSYMAGRFAGEPAPSSCR